MSKFKVGDRVRIVEDCKPEVGHAYGSIHTVADFNIRGVSFDDTNGMPCFYYEHEVELVVEPEAPEGPFYVLALPQFPFKTLEEAESDLRARATEFHQTTYGIFKGVKAMRLVTEVKEVPFHG